MSDDTADATVGSTTRSTAGNSLKPSQPEARLVLQARVSEARGWDVPQAAAKATEDLQAYRCADAGERSSVGAEIALRVRNSAAYRDQALKEEPETTRSLLQQPVVGLGQGLGQDHRAPVPPAADKPGPTFNSVSPDLPTRSTPDTEQDAQLRSQAKASIAPADKQAEVKREVIDRMTPDELKQFAAANGNRDQADQTLRSTAHREEREAAKAPSRAAEPPLEERFNITKRLLSTQYEFREQPGKVAFSERFHILRSEANSAAATIAMIDRAAERGWRTVRLDGSAEFRRQAWIAAQARGMHAVGYEPTKGDREAMAAERERRERSAPGTGERTQAAQAKVPENEVRSSAYHATAYHPKSVNAVDIAIVGSAPVQERQTGERDPQAQRSEAKHAVERTADPRVAERGRDQGPDRGRDRNGGGSGVGAVMRALELVMEREGVPQSQRTEIRAMASRELNALRSTGKTARVRVVDRKAPRVPQVVPHYELRRNNQERTR